MVSLTESMDHEWLVRMKVECAVSIGTKVTFDNVVFVQRKKWIEASVKVRELNKDAAESVAVRKVSDVLNALSFISDCSIKLVGIELVERNNSLLPVTIRMLTNNEINNWKSLDRMTNSDIFRGLGYYRKGLNELDPFDAFLAFWNAIEIICSGDESRGIAQKIFSWARTHTMSLDENEIHDLKDTRNRIVHGNKRYDIEQIKYVAKKIPRIRELARAFLTVELSLT